MAPVVCTEMSLAESSSHINSCYGDASRHFNSFLVHVYQTMRSKNIPNILRGYTSQKRILYLLFRKLSTTVALAVSNSVVTKGEILHV